MKKAATDEANQSNQTPFRLAKNATNVKSQRTLTFRQPQRFSLINKAGNPEEVKMQPERSNKMHRASMLVKRPNVAQSARNLVESSEDE